MDVTRAVAGLSCVQCGAERGPDHVGRCPACDGPLLVDIAPDELDRATLPNSPVAGLEQFAAGLPLVPDRRRSLSAGGTPLVGLPAVAEASGVGGLWVKGEGRNPTGSLADRGAGLIVEVAARRGASAVGLPSAGPSAQAVAAAAARAGLDSHAFVPARAPFDCKAMVNVHGGEMTVVPGGFAAAAEAYRAASETAEWLPAGPFATPYPIEGAKTVAYELARQRDWQCPDAVVTPVGQGTALAGVWKGFDELRRFGLLDGVPRLCAVQPTGCAPVVDGWESDGPGSAVVAHPDTICGDLEIPAPTGAAVVRHALERTDGTAVAVDDDESLAAAVSLARAGPAASLAGGVALAGLRSLVQEGILGPDHEVVLVDPIDGPRNADVLRSHLMRTGE